MKYIDIHTHTSTVSEEVVEVINLMFEDVRRNDIPDGNCYNSVGIHPWELNSVSLADLARLRDVAADNRVKLIGECGLDKNLDVDSDKQMRFFVEQINISEELRKPLIIHCVGCFNELIELKRQLKPSQTWIVHGFRGKPQLARQLLDMGFMLSFGEKFNVASVEITPLDCLLVESDESVLPIEDIYKIIAQVKKCEVAELTKTGNFLLTLI